MRSNVSLRLWLLALFILTLIHVRIVHADRDKILLEGEDDWDDDGLGDQNEVFGLKGLQSSDEDEEEEEGDFDEEEEEPSASKALKSSKVAASAPGKASLKAEEESEEEDDEGWGRKQSAYYIDGPDDVSEEDEEELEKMEEEEARRLQRKAREQLSEEDYGLDFARNSTSEVEENDILKELETLPSTSSAPPKSKAMLLKELERSDPASLALARDWERVAEDVVRIEAALKTCVHITQIRVQFLYSNCSPPFFSREPDDPALGLMHLHYRTRNHPKLFSIPHLN